MDAPLLHPGVVFPDLDDGLARSWLSAVHWLARQNGGQVQGGVDKPDVDQNYYSVVVALPQATVTLLLNTGARLVACVTGERPFPTEATFIEVPSPEVFTPLGLSAARVDDMEQTLTEKHLTALPRGEAKEVRYYDPPRVGEVIFNWFD